MAKVKENIDSLLDIIANHTPTKEIVVFNDDVNTFDFVITTLCLVCGHDPIQAEQCAITAHNVGKCVVKSGAFLDMFELKTTFDDLEIKSEIEEYASGMY